MEEVYKPIPEFPNYQISNLGNVLGKNNYVITPIVKKHGGAEISLYKEGKRNYRLLAKLVAETFNLEKKNESLVLGFKDKNKLNVSLNNLIYIDRSDSQINSKEKASYITFHKQRNKFVCQGPKPDRIFVGRFDTYEEALEARQNVLGF